MAYQFPINKYARAIVYASSLPNYCPRTRVKLNTRFRGIYRPAINNEGIPLMPITNVHHCENQLLGLNGKSTDVTRGYRFGTRPMHAGTAHGTIDYFNIAASYELCSGI